MRPWGLDSAQPHPSPGSWPGVPSPQPQQSQAQARIPLQRLDRRFDEWESRRLVLIEAGAGYGKTTLLAADVCRSGRRIFWHSFEFVDAGLSPLSTKLAAALDIPAEPPPDPDALLPLLIEKIRATPAGWSLVLNEMERAASGPDWFSYFTRDVVVHLDPPLARFVTRASVLPFLTPALGRLDERVPVRALPMPDQ